LRVWVLLTLLVGALGSSIGAMNSHAFAVLDAVRSVDTSHGADQPHAHDHSHDDLWLADIEGAAHSHLGADHSHDKAHALPILIKLANAAPSGWARRTIAWCERWPVHRLERPPKAV
jgi:hypothetical protein